MTLKDLPHKELVGLMAKEHGHNNAWKEFLDRFHRFVCFTISKECARLGYKEGARNVEDLAHLVYQRLLNNESQALKKFVSKHDNSIFRYLQIIAIRTVLINFGKDYGTQKRCPPGWMVSIDTLQQLGLDIASHQEMGSGLIGEIVICLKRILEESRHKDRDMLILQLYFFKDIKPDLISSRLRANLSPKRVANIITETTPKLRKCLRERNIDA